MNFDYIQADAVAATESAQANAEQRLQFEDEIQKQFEYLWERCGITGNTTPALLEALKEVALKWYMRGRFNE